MKPNNRPGSAKSHVTKITMDSDHSKKEINVSQYSKTSSDAHSFFNQPDPFMQKVERMNKDPKYRHLNQNLDVIEEKRKKQEEKKPSYKPNLLDKKRAADRGGKKEEVKLEEERKEEEELNLSSGFAKKTKNKFDNLKGKKEQNQTSKTGQPNFESFKYNKTAKEAKGQVKVGMKKNGRAGNGSVLKSKTKISPTKQGEKDEVEKTQPQKKQKVEAKQKGGKKTEAEQQRQTQMKNLERYVNQIEARNSQIFTQQYDRMIHSNPSNVEDLQKIDINNFLADPTEQGYEVMMGNIQFFDQKLGAGVEEQSIDLEELISNDSSSKQKEKVERSQQCYEQQTENDQENYLDSMSASQLVERNAFITDVLKGSKISRRQLNELEEKEKSAVRIHKLQREKTEEKNDEDGDMGSVNMMKKQSQRMIEKNIIEAGGHIYRDCDYLSQEHQRRLEQLIEGDIGESPFECDEMERMRRRRIDEGIHMYREMSDAGEVGEIINEEMLPKDPETRKKAEKRILTDKIKSVNERLGQVDKMPATKTKIKSLIEQFQYTKHSQAYNQLYEQNQQRFQQNLKKLQQAENMIQNFQQKENINEIIDDIDEQYRQLEQQIKRFAEIDAEKLKKMEQERLKRKLRELEQMQKENWELEGEIVKMEGIKQEVQDNLKIYDQFQRVELPQLQCQNYFPMQTVEDIDEVITKKWEESEQMYKDGSEPETQS